MKSSALLLVLALASLDVREVQADSKTEPGGATRFGFRQSDLRVALHSVRRVIDAYRRRNLAKFATSFAEDYILGIPPAPDSAKVQAPAVAPKDSALAGRPAK